MLPQGLWPYDSLKKILLSFNDHRARERLYLVVDAMDELNEQYRYEIIDLLR